MRTFDVKFKRKVVREYLSGKGGYKILAAKFDIAESMVRKWVGAYQYHGTAGLDRQRGRYTCEFKLEVLHRLAVENLSCRELAAMYNIGNPHSITICQVLQVAPSAYWLHAARTRNPALRSVRERRDEVLILHIERVWHANLRVYGAVKVWRQLRREGIAVARCTVERLMRRLGLRGAVRGKPVCTTMSDKAAPCPLDRVNRQFRADRPNQLWGSDFTYVSTWQGFVYVAFVIDVFSRRIVGWRVSSSMQTDFVLDALEQALYARRPQNGLIHHSDRGSQYVSIRYSERLAEAGIEPSVGSKGDSYDNALAETINGLYKAEVIHRRAPWKTREAVELATLEWVSWFNHHRLMEPLGYIPPVEAEANHYRQLSSQAIPA